VRYRHGMPRGTEIIDRIEAKPIRLPRFFQERYRRACVIADIYRHNYCVLSLLCQRA